MERKRKKRDEGTLAKDIVSLVVYSRSMLTKVKKQKTLPILGQDPETRHLKMEIAMPKKGGRINDMMADDFTLHLVDLGEAKHDTKVDLWRSSNEVIEGKLASLKLSKIRMKAEIEDLNKFIRQLVTPFTTISSILVTKNPTITEVQALISQL